MIVIIEGVDRVGKTTLCNMLKECGYQVLNGKLKYDGNNTHIKQLVEHDRIFAQTDLLKLIDNDINLVIDRFHLSQYVYGLINRGENDSEMIMTIDKDLAKLNCKLVFVDPINIQNSSEEHLANLERHQILFDICKQFTKIPYVVVNYDTLKNAITFVRG